MGKAANREASGESMRDFECNKREFAEESPIDQALSDGLQQCQYALMANPRMSRRAFFGGAAVVGALAFLGSVRTSGGLIVNAYADENGSASFSVYVLAARKYPSWRFPTPIPQNSLLRALRLPSGRSITARR